MPFTKITAGDKETLEFLSARSSLDTIDCVDYSASQNELIIIPRGSDSALSIPLDDKGKAFTTLYVRHKEDWNVSAAAKQLVTTYVSYNLRVLIT